MKRAQADERLSGDQKREMLDKLDERANTLIGSRIAQMKRKLAEEE